MTGNQIKGKGFKGALRYNLEKVSKGVAEILDHTFASPAERTILKEIQMVKAQRPNLRKYFYHTSLNFPPNENLSNDKIKKIGLEYLHANGFTQHQYILFRHYDAGHPHVHILVNRIGYDGTVLSDSNDFARSEKVLRQLELKHNLTPVISSKQAQHRAITKDEREMMKRTGIPSGKLALQVIIKQVLSGSQKLTCSEFIHALQSNSVNVLFNQATTGFVSGISYSYKGNIITGSKLGNDFKWGTIKNLIDYNQERDREIIQRVNTGTKSSQQELSTTPYNMGWEWSGEFDLHSILKGLSPGDLLHADQQSEVDPEKALRLKKRKKARRV